MNRYAPIRPHQPSEKAIRSVFVGNIGYDISEEELAQVFSKVGPVVSFRLVHDRESGKSKGFGFCEYQDAATASNCIRVMNQYELKGRSLRLDSAVANERMMLAEDFQVRPPTKAQMPSQISPQLSTGGPQITPTAADLHSYGIAPLNGQTPEAIAKTLSNLSPELMFKVIQDMKELAQSNPRRCRQILDSNPQLSFALLQAQVMMHWLNIDTAFSLLDKNMSQEKMAERAEMSMMSNRDESVGHAPSIPQQPYRPPLMQQPSSTSDMPSFFNQPTFPRPQFNPQTASSQGPPQATGFHSSIPQQQQQVPRPLNSWVPAPQQQSFNHPPQPFGAFNQQQPEFGDSFRNYGSRPNLPPQQGFGGPRPFGQGLPPQNAAFRAHQTKLPSPHGFSNAGPRGDVDDEAEMINQLLSLTEEQIQALDPDEQAKVRELKRQLGQ